MEGCIQTVDPLIREALKPPSDGGVDTECDGTMYDVAVYACGQQPLACGIQDYNSNLHDHQLKAIRTSLLEHCASKGGIGKHSCSTGVKVWSMGKSRFTKSSCTPSTEAGAPCPCHDEHKLSAWGYAQV